MRQITMAISGMSCGGCVKRVTQALSTIPGTRVDAVTVGSATVSYDESRTTPAAIDRAVREAGYQPGPVGAAVPVAPGGGCCGSR